MKTAFANGLLVLVSLLLALLLAEAGLRLSGHHLNIAFQSRLGIEKIHDPAPDLPYLYKSYASFSEHWPDNRNGYFDPVTNGVFYRVNNYGFRDNDFSRRRNQRIRIAFLGDSFCWGNGVKAELRFSDLMEQLLNRFKPGGLEYEVYNFCLGNYNAKSEAALYESVVRYFSPDILMIWYFPNDIGEVGTMRFIGGDNLLVDWRRHSYLLDAIVYPIDRYLGSGKLIEYYNRQHEAGERGLTQVDDALERIAELARKSGVETFLAIFPVLFRMNENDYPFRGVHESVALVAKKHGFQVIDLLPAFYGSKDSDLWVHPVDQHPNFIAHRIAAKPAYQMLHWYLERNAMRIQEKARARREATAVYPEEGIGDGNWWAKLQAGIESH